MNTDDARDSARTLATQFGWPVMPIKPHGKEPLTAHGVKDATTDTAVIDGWFDRWPDANLAIATGAPGPSVLDVDRPDAAGPVLEAVRRIHGPIVATVRGFHHYFAGTTSGTITLEYGELRGRGSYILIPPSIHPSGKQYVWLEAPNGALPPIPDVLAGARQPAGTGDFDAPERIPFGQRHDQLKTAVIHLLRAGITDVPTLEHMLESFFRKRFEQSPPPKRNEFHDLAVWASKTDIAARERNRELTVDELAGEEGKATKRKSALDHPPGQNGTLKEHRDYVHIAAGLPASVDIVNVIRRGQHDGDELAIELSNGLRIRFGAQHRASKRAEWARTVITCTSGIGNPPALNDWQAVQVFRSLCILATPAPEQREESIVADLLDDLLAIADPTTDHDPGTSEGRYDLIAHCRARPWSARAHDRDDTHRPLLIIDPATGARYLRAGDLHDYFNYRGYGVMHADLRGRMAMVGGERVELRGREQRRPDRAGRRTNRAVLYRFGKEAVAEDDE